MRISMAEMRLKGHFGAEMSFPRQLPSGPRNWAGIRIVVGIWLCLTEI